MGGEFRKYDKFIRTERDFMTAEIKLTDADRRYKEMKKVDGAVFQDTLPRILEIDNTVIRQ